MPWSFASGSFGASSSTFGSAFATCTGCSTGFFSALHFRLRHLDRRRRRCRLLFHQQTHDTLRDLLAVDDQRRQRDLRNDRAQQNRDQQRQRSGLAEALVVFAAVDPGQDRFARLLVDLALDLPFVAELLFLVLHLEQRALDRVDRVVVQLDLLAQRRLATFHVAEPLAQLGDAAARSLQVLGRAFARTCRRPRTACRRRLPRASPAPRRPRRRADAARVAEQALRARLRLRAARARGTPASCARAPARSRAAAAAAPDSGSAKLRSSRMWTAAFIDGLPISAAPRARSFRTWWPCRSP